LRFLKRYFIGLIFFYLIIFVVIFIFLIKINKIDSDIIIPRISLENQFGELKTFSDYKGKVLLVDFWYQGCQPCLEEMKYFPELLNKYNSELAIMSISIDSKEDTQDLLELKPKPWNFLQSKNSDWTFYNDDKKNSLVKELKVSEYPTYLLFNKEGELISSPYSGVAAVENKLSGIFGLNLAYVIQKENLKKLPALVIPYTVFVLLILFIEFLVYLFKKLFQKKIPMPIHYKINC
jgi:cytochrome oxidase Cu insertion factor (SCO1/SenC/PrrC family)